MEEGNEVSEEFLNEVSCGRSSSYTTLLSYCEDKTWEDEVNDVKEDVWRSKSAEAVNLWESVKPDKDTTEIGGLQDAFQSMSKLSAEYISLEKSMTMYNKDDRHLPTGPYPVIQVGSEVGRNLALKNHDYSPSVYREGIMLCRDWLQEHYDSRDGVSILRSAMYRHYLDFCMEAHLEPVNTASFGKAVRATFPNIKTRRLGMRGHSKYHYYGLTVRENSPYRDILLSSHRLNNEMLLQSRLDSSAANQRHFSRTFSAAGPRSIESSGLHGFPSHLSVSLSRDLKLQLSGLLSEYRACCEHALRHVRTHSLGDVRVCMHAFWSTLRPDMRALLKNPVVSDVISLCDRTLQRAISQFLVANFTEGVCATHERSANGLCEQIVAWTRDSMRGYHPHLTQVRLQAAQDFADGLQRQLALAKLCHVGQPIMRNREDQTHMAMDWRAIDYEAVSMDVAMEMGGGQHQRVQFYVRKCLNDFEKLLWQHASLHKFLQFTENVLRYSITGPGEADSRAALFTMRWCLAVQIISRELTLAQAASLDKLHLLGQVLTDYILLQVETERCNRRENSVKSAVYTGTERIVESLWTHRPQIHSPGRPLTAGTMSQHLWLKHNSVNNAQVSILSNTQHNTLQQNTANNSTSISSNTVHNRLIHNTTNNSTSLSSNTEGNRLHQNYTNNMAEVSNNQKADVNNNIVDLTSSLSNEKDILGKQNMLNIKQEIAMPQYHEIANMKQEPNTFDDVEMSELPDLMPEPDIVVSDNKNNTNTEKMDTGVGNSSSEINIQIKNEPITQELFSTDVNNNALLYNDVIASSSICNGKSSGIPLYSSNAIDFQLENVQGLVNLSADQKQVPVPHIKTEPIVSPQLANTVSYDSTPTLASGCVANRPIVSNGDAFARFNETSSMEFNTSVPKKYTQIKPIMMSSAGNKTNSVSSMAGTHSGTSGKPKFVTSLSTLKPTPRRTIISVVPVKFPRFSQNRPFASTCAQPEAVTSQSERSHAFIDKYLEQQASLMSQVHVGYGVFKQAKPSFGISNFGVKSNKDNSYIQALPMHSSHSETSPSQNLTVLNNKPINSTLRPAQQIYAVMSNRPPLKNTGSEGTANVWKRLLSCEEMKQEESEEVVL